MYAAKKFNLDDLTEEELQTKLRNSALGSLGMREHSVGELQKKLEQKFERKDAVVEVIDWLLDLGYLNDQRFAEIFVRASIAKGRGPVRIKQELQQKSVATTIIAEAIELADVDWQQLSAEVLSRRFSEQPSDQKERAKQMRFLQSRGFTPDCIYRACKYNCVTTHC